MRVGRSRTTLLLVVALLVSSAAVATTGVAQSSGAALADEYEPNDEYSQATQISDGSYSADVVEDERDIYAISVSEGDVITANVSYSEDVAYEPDFEITDASGTTVQDGVRKTSPLTSRVTQQATFQAQTGGTYYLVVDGDFASDTTVPYSFSVDRNTNDRYETNADFSMAASVSDGRYDGLSAYWDERDVYSFDVSEGDVITANVSYSDDVAYEPDFEVMDSAGTTVQDGVRKTSPLTSRVTQQAVFEAQTGGTYYIVVDGDFASESGVPYSFSLERNTNDRFETNFDFGAATQVTDGEYGNLTAYWDERDVYSFEVSEGDVITANISYSDDVAYEPDFEVMDSAGTTVQDGVRKTSPLTSTVTQQAVFEAQTGGTYYLVVDGDFASESGVPYSVSLSRNTNDRFETNFDFSTATQVSDGEYGNLTAYWDERDAYQFQADAGDVINTSVSYSDGVRFEPDFEVMDSAGTSVQDGVRKTSPLTSTVIQRGVFQVDSSGTYYLVVDGDFASESRVGYNLSLSRNTNDPTEPNSRLASAVAVDGERRSDLAIEWDERDVFTVSPVAGGNVTASISYSDSVSSEPDLELLDPSGTTIEDGERSTDPTSDTVTRRVSTTVESGGAHYLRIEGDFTSETTVDYTLDVTAPSGVTEPATPTLPGASNPAKNVDDDALLEDINGDGEGNIFDVLTYYQARNSDAVQDNPDRFDFDGDGTAGTIFDALELYSELSG